MLTVHIADSEIEDLIRDFTDAGVEFSRRRTPIGIPIACTAVVEIATVSIPVAGAVLVAWLKYRPTRKLMIETKKGDVISIEAPSAAELTKLLESSNSVVAFDPKKKTKVK